MSEWKDANHKPPNETWVEVKDGEKVVEAMAYYGRDGYRPHWRLRDGTCCHPSRFSRWREIEELRRGSDD
jgi:hypothetical protein